MEPKIPEDIYKSHLEQTSKHQFINILCVLSFTHKLLFSDHMLPKSLHVNILIMAWIDEITRAFSI